MKDKINSIFSLTEKKKMLISDLLMIAVVVSVVVLVAYKVNNIYPFGDASIVRGDMVQQTIPAGVYYVWDILHGNVSPFFTWNSALGLNLSGAASLGALLSPLNLFLFFSTRENLVYFVNILLMLKMISTAFSMYFYLRKYDVRRMIHIAGGILYAFGAAALVHFQIILVLDMAFLLPLIMIGFDRIFDKKGCKFFIVVFALSIMVNVYMSGIALIFLLLSSGMRIFMDTDEKEERRRCVLWLGVSVVFAALLSAVVSIPAILCIIETSRTGDGNFLSTYMTALKSTWGSGYGARDWKEVERMCVNIALPCASIVFFMLNGKESLRENIRKYKSRVWVTALMLLSVFSAGIEMLWHGGTRASWPVRFVFVISFVLIDFAVVLYQENKDHIEESIVEIGKSLMEKIMLLIPLVAAVVSGLVFCNIYDVYCKNTAYQELGDGFLCIFAELLFACAYWCLWKSKRKVLILVILCVELTCTSVISFAPNKDNSATFSVEHIEAANNAAMSMDTEINDFERMKNVDYKLNNLEYSLVFGSEAISNYWHVISPSLQPAFSALGYTINWTQLVDTGGTVFTDTLLHMKYFLSQGELSDRLYDFCQNLDGSQSDELRLYKNKFELPFVISTDATTLGPSGEKFVTQNSLFAGITGLQDPLIEDVSNQVYNNTYNIMVGNGEKAIYFYGTNSTDNGINITVNGNPIIIPSSYSTSNQTYPADFGSGMICLGCFQNESVSVQFGGASASDIHIGLLDMSTFNEGLEVIKSQNPKIVSLEQKKSSVEIELENVKKSNIFIPISYDKGWVCEVNGEKVEDIENIDGMLSIPVTEGKNSIQLKYVAPGRTMGAALSVCALVIIAAFVFITKKKVINIEKISTIAGYVAYAIFAVLFAAFIIVLFVIPTMFWLKDVFFVSE